MMESLKMNVKSDINFVEIKIYGQHLGDVKVTLRNINYLIGSKKDYRLV